MLRRCARDPALIIAALALLALAISALYSCAPRAHESTLERRVVAAAWEGWERAGLPDIDESHCQTHRFEIRYPDGGGFNALCYPSSTATANGCFRWLLVQHRAMDLYSIAKPVAVVDPTLPVGASVPELALHELMHGLIDCTMHRDYLDPFDAGHTDVRVWGDKDHDGAEEYAVEALAR